MANIDAELMGRQTLKDSEEERAARELRQSQAQARNPEAFAPALQDTTNNQQVLQAKMKKDAEKDKSSEKAGPARGAAAGTALWLKAAWLNIIDSFGLTLIYINLHVFGNSIVGDKIFCNLGEEWIPPNADAATVAALTSKIRTIGMIEKILLITIDLLLLIDVLMCLALLISIANFYFTFWVKAALKIADIVGIKPF